MDPLVYGPAAVVALLFGAVGYLGRGLVERSRRKKSVAAAADEASRILGRAKEEAKNLQTARVLEGKEEAIRLRESWEQEESKHRKEVERAEERLAERSTSMERRFDNLNERESAQEKRAKELEAGNEGLAAKTQDLAQDRERVREKLESLAGMSQPEAKKELLADLQDEARAEAANTLREIKEEAQRTADGEAKKILGLAIQRMAADQTAEMTVSVVQLPSDEMKGRIIGREGRNIRAFEQATGIDVIIDDTPEAVVLSGFNPVRREVARIALGRLIEDGRIHPGRIEEVV
ncbi:MAG TPA: ribonuclease Y, partial [Gemmatimonadetes bacterium]|nr:ribonuclease Y [Gemmatimonadota bacterium]